MRGISEARLLDRQRRLREEYQGLRQKAQAIKAEMRVVSALLVEDVAELGPVPTPAPARSVAPAPADFELMGESAELKPKTVAAPAQNDVQGPLLEIVRSRPGIPRPDAQRMVLEVVPTSIQSARETVRRMLNKGKLRIEDGLLYLNENGTEGE
jgi:hypothetical protein